MQKHSRLTPTGRAFWWTERLWQLVADLPEIEVTIDSITEFDLNCWFREAPTCREVAEHARRIFAADTSFPIILAADGGLMDGGHRVAKAWLEGRATVKAQRFEQDPTPDWIEPAEASGARI